MKILENLTLAMALALPAVTIATSATGQVATVATADPDGAISDSAAWKAAAAQLQTTYKGILDQAEARRTQITNELQPLVTAYQAAASAPGANEATLRQQATSIQSKQQAGQAELERLTAPFARARAYAIEQLQGQLKAAIDAAAARKHAGLVVAPSAVFHVDPAGDITADVTTELNRLIPSVSITPPANWQPGQQQAGAQTPSTPAAPATGRRPQGR